MLPVHVCETIQEEMDKTPGLAKEDYPGQHFVDHKAAEDLMRRVMKQTRLDYEAEQAAVAARAAIQVEQAVRTAPTPAAAIIVIDEEMPDDGITMFTDASFAPGSSAVPSTAYAEGLAIEELHRQEARQRSVAEKVAEVAEARHVEIVEALRKDAPQALEHKVHEVVSQATAQIETVKFQAQTAEQQAAEKVAHMQAFMRDEAEKRRLAEAALAVSDDKAGTFKPWRNAGPKK